AAWLIENSGFGKGFALPGSGASVSRLHCLALTNRGTATAADVVALAQTVRAGVLEKFGLELVPEPNQIGVEI
ncbi:MAG: UDP-N-acetylenolpyruvoylglucosamine reductase, partial [Cellulomonadaceae bacterium]|nr:UDP-N-acetylenolpyruvoylglucosamine reductase [Cellulomonadaceae bacterium]